MNFSSIKLTYSFCDDWLTPNIIDICQTTSQVYFPFIWYKGHSNIPWGIEVYILGPIL